MVVVVVAVEEEEEEDKLPLEVLEQCDISDKHRCMVRMRRVMYVGCLLVMMLSPSISADGMLLPVGSGGCSCCCLEDDGVGRNLVDDVVVVVVDVDVDVDAVPTVSRSVAVVNLDKDDRQEASFIEVSFIPSTSVVAAEFMVMELFGGAPVHPRWWFRLSR